MKINNSTKKSLLIIALAMASTTYQTQAAPIEHIGDRYIMHIPEMELTGEESLLDVLMMSHLARRQQHHRRRSIRQPLRQVRHPHRQPGIRTRLRHLPPPFQGSGD